MRPVVYASEGSVLRCLQSGRPLPVSLVDGGVPMRCQVGAVRGVTVTPDGVVRIPVFQRVHAVQSTVHGVQSAARVVLGHARSDLWVVVIRRAVVDLSLATVVVADMRVLQERHPRQVVTGWLVTSETVSPDAVQVLRAAGHLVTSGIPIR